MPRPFSGLDQSPFSAKRDELTAEEGVANDLELDSEALERLAFIYEALIVSESDEIEDDPMQQLIEAARAVYRSWNGDRALTYRRLQGFDDLKGSAVMVQAMVFGNSGAASGSGVAFSRDPSTGDADPVIDVLFEAQGEDVVSGRARPKTRTSSRNRLPPSPPSCVATSSSSSGASRTCRTSNSPSKMEGFGFCRAARPNAPRARRSSLRSISSRKVSSHRKRRCGD